MIEPFIPGLVPPHRRLSASVIVPAKNEARHLVAALDALNRQVDLQGRPLWRDEYEAIVLVNNSTDESLALVERYRQSHPGLRLLAIHRDFDRAEAYIGNIRRILMDEAAARLRAVGMLDGLILSTDADTEVEPDWIARNRQEVARGAEAVGGRIKLRASELGELDERTREIQLLDEQYGLLTARLEAECDPVACDPWPRHHQHFGGSLAVKASVYERVGGLPRERSLEDVAFHRLLAREDVRFRHSPAVRVRTSPRLRGRTEIGLAEQLTRWSESGKSPSEIPVPAVEWLRRLFLLRRDFRRLWTRERTNSRRFAIASGVKESEVEAALECRTFGAAFEMMNLPGVLGESHQPLRSAVEELELAFAPAESLSAALG